ncbi:MAG: hypothetical protein L6264_11380 [Weeksellaceae bacterium]|nr:hypothetical protein [Bacteroidota bacterium]MCG2781539.1 hypothetical protein [Weeksellaceae bacterium]
MKKFLQLSILFLFASFYGQNISDYRYIYVPSEFSDVKANKYGLNTLLNEKLKQKKFMVVAGDKTQWPEEAKQNPCEVLTAGLRDTSNMFKNKVAIDFVDCNNKTVATVEGKSSIKEFEPGMREALEMAAKSIAVSSPVKQNIAVKTPAAQHQTQAVSVEEASVHKPDPKTENKAEIFSNGNLMLNRIFISDSQFILANPNNSTPYAIFKASTKKDVYRVQLQDGTQTLGYMEDGKIIIELQSADGSFRKEIFEGK